ncbi:MFS transporter [Micromonospora viridifaciens]|uniref:MFS transporter n=1 Tax=Micromonospora viridifaciens TaxID=1881 RepID=UPI0022B250C6|nr:MFS transporter [Micromonospora viridifaciens]
MAFGVWGALAGLAAAVGPIIGGVLVSSLSWRWIFFVNVPVGVVALALTMLRVAESRDEQAKRPDWPGFVIFSRALAALIYALIEAGRSGFTGTIVIACFAAAAVLLIAFLLVGVGLLLMRGLTAASSWAHLIPGLIMAGVGVGFVNPPLASTAVGVVETRRSGMASGINLTFRQVGIATGVGLLGTLFANRLTTVVQTQVAGTPLAEHSADIAAALRNGSVSRLFATVPPQQRGLLVQIARGSYASALNEILLLAGIVTIVAGVLSFVMIRSKDFVSPPHG